MIIAGLAEKTSEFLLKQYNATGDYRFEDAAKLVDDQATRITELEVQLAEAKKANQWQPIETAPRDSTAILAIVSGTGSDGLAYKPSTVQIDHTQIHLFCDSDEDSWIDLSEWKLTHWMPLPQAPATSTT